MNEERLLNSKGYSERNERRILNVLGRGLLKEFPNPDRIGCPGRDVLGRIAAHQVPLPEAERWLDHLGSCSPCYSDYSKFRSAYRLRRNGTLLAVAASILIAAGVAGWVLLQKHNESLVAQTAVLDLRNHSVSRGTESNPGEQPLEVSRATRRLNIYLPLGSAEGPYDVRISTSNGQSLFSGEGVVQVQQGISSLQLDINLPSANPGAYLLQLRKKDSNWNSYPLRIR